RGSSCPTVRLSRTPRRNCCTNWRTSSPRADRSESCQSGGCRMSMHEIEDLVEQSVRLVLASDGARDHKVATIGQLYAVQAWFDTSDTTGRLAEDLQAIGYVDAAPPRRVALLRLAADMMQAGNAADRVEIAQGWLALALTAITDLDLTDQIPATFDGMLAGGDGPRMRAMAL